MQPAQGKPGRIPPATHSNRDICATVRTWQIHAYERLVSATATCKIRVKHPDEAPCFMRMLPEGFGVDGPGRGFTGWWEGRGEVQVWAADELLALTRLFSTLEGLDLPVPWAARDVLAELQVATTLPITHESWPLMPLGLRGKRPRRERHCFKDGDGKVRRVYKDTLRAHADPNCTCILCKLTTPHADET